MSKIFNAKNIRQYIGVMGFYNPCEVVFDSEKGNKIITADKKVFESACINCVHPRCMMLDKHEIECDLFSELSHDVNLGVCPKDAIKVGMKRISIDGDKCIGCGLCATRCGLGAITIKAGIAKVSENESVEYMSLTEENMELQKVFLSKLETVNKSGNIIIESDEVIEKIYERLGQLSQEKQNIFVRNALIALGNKATLSRKGNVYQRMDGFYQNSKGFGVIEIETGSEMLDVSRAILDDIAVVDSRYDLKKDDNQALAICLGFPNKRTDYWQVVKDIQVVTGVQIRTLTFGALLIMLWSLKSMEDFDPSNIDEGKESIRKAIETAIGRKVNISVGTKGVLEISK